MSKTKIEWCDMTVNPVVGCTYGCEYCYARKMNQRFGWIKDFSEPQFFHERLQQLYTKTPKIIFINSMSDIADWELPWLWQVYVSAAKNPQNTYLALTKRPNDISPIEYNDRPNNLWIGQTITKGGTALIHEQVDFLSIEPLLGEVKLDLADTNIKWVIIGAETGNRKGKVIPKREWVYQIMKECENAGCVPVFMKSSMESVMEGDTRMEWPDFIKAKHDKKDAWGVTV